MVVKLRFGSAVVALVFRDSDESDPHVVRRPVPFLVAKRGSEQPDCFINDLFAGILRQRFEHSAAERADPSPHAAVRQRRGPQNQCHSLYCESVLLKPSGVDLRSG